MDLAQITLICKEELMSEIKKKFGNLDNDSGAYIRTEHGLEWLSVSSIVDIIDGCSKSIY